ncbi:gp53-like domain-containing protein [Sphingorhabdus sp. 109]|uniref:gp53-like domain-containing protein n=1 Tax=Sphingorhabdus sp. 109 TaxID=2653173 RepID=UPI0012EF3E61|nr:hypothetical protein [Sphingorhabdus sp. 109]VWX62616.1 conserved hypothetical protein [Sphingorhabdus sp. 109]
MFRIDSPGSVDGRFNAGNPGTGQQATQLSADWFNALQDEIVNVLEQAEIDPDKADSEQLYAAILAIATGAAGDGSGAVPTSRTISAAGLATGGGDLAVNRTITVPKASAGDVSTGTDDTKAVTALALQGGLGGQLLAGTGFKTIFGLVFQWGTATVSGDGSTNVTLPTTFSSQCVFAGFNGGSVDTGVSHNGPYVSGKSVSALTVFSALNTSTVGQFFAIGF